MYKFCRTFDEDENAYVGGTTVLEGLYHCLSNKDSEIKKEEAHGDDDLEDEFATRKFSKSVSGGTPISDEIEKPTTVKTCCRACFCCITKNTVDGYQEMALNIREESTIQGTQVQFAELDLKNAMNIEENLEVNLGTPEDDFIVEEVYNTDDY